MRGVRIVLSLLVASAPDVDRVALADSREGLIV